MVYLQVIKTSLDIEISVIAHVLVIKFLHALKAHATLILWKLLINISGYMPLPTNFLSIYVILMHLAIYRVCIRFESPTLSKIRYVANSAITVAKADS